MMGMVMEVAEAVAVVVVLPDQHPTTALLPCRKQAGIRGGEI